MTKVYASAHTVSVHIKQPLEEVFDFITTASNWPKWHPATVSVSGAVSHPALEGETIVEKVKYGLALDTFSWKVEECQAPNRWAILATSDRYRQKVRIAYTLTPENGGTLWEREMCFYIRKSLGLLDKLVFSKLLKRNSEKAVRQLKELMEQGSLIN
jgi:uncharacterized protein YndB with AHSA1/START domain